MSAKTNTTNGTLHTQRGGVVSVCVVYKKLNKKNIKCTAGWHKCRSSRKRKKRNEQPRTTKTEPSLLGILE